MFYHLFHREILRERALLVAVYAVVPILASVGIRARDLVRERHSAALAEIRFHNVLTLI